MGKIFSTTGKIKNYNRDQKQGYIVPDKTLDGFTGQNILFTDGDLKGVKSSILNKQVLVDFHVLNGNLVAVKVIDEEVCESCDDKGYLEVTRSDSCEYIKACENCNYIDFYGDLEEKARDNASRDGYELDKNGKIINN